MMPIHPAARRLPLAQGPTLLLLAIVAAVSAAIHGRPFWIDNSVMIAIFSLMALSVGLSYGQAGILSMATAGFAAVGAFGSAILCTRYGLTPLAGLGFAVVAPMALAYPLARCLVRLSPLSLSIATFLTGSVLEIAVREGGDFTGGYLGISAIPRPAIAPTAQAMHFVAWGAVIVSVFLYVNLMHSPLGRALRTARQDALRATADGTGVPHLLAGTFALSAAMAGVAGWLYAHHLTYVGPDSLTAQVSISVMLMAVVGGARTFLGPILGAALLSLITLYLPAAESQGMVFGALLVLMLLVAPEGLLGLCGKWLARPRRAARAPVAVSGAALPGEGA
ncbi:MULTISPECIES: branched-chain amino acid ABC transporter permease [Cupriavidus]